MPKLSKVKQIKASVSQEKRLIAHCVPVAIVAGEMQGEKQGPAKFSVTAYTGEPMKLNGWDRPVVVDIEGMQFADTITANLDHESTKRVGHVTEATKHDGQVLLAGVCSAVSSAKEEVVASGSNGYPWKASIEADPLKVVDIAGGKTLKANGREYVAPKGGLYYVPESLLSAFGFVTRGADKKATASIAASAANKEKTMKAECKAWVKETIPSLDVENLSEDQIVAFEADFAGLAGRRRLAATSSNPFEENFAENKRVNDINAASKRHVAIHGQEGNNDFLAAVEKMRLHALAHKMDAQDYRIKLAESCIPDGHTVAAPKMQSKLTGKILEAALCKAGGLQDLDKHFTDQELQLAHDEFKDRIGLNQFIIEAARVNGYTGSTTGGVTPEIQNYAFNPRMIRAAGGGFSMLEVGNIVAATANKFMMEGWMHVDLTPLRIAAIRNVKNFQQTTTVSLTGHLQFGLIGGDGELKHGTMADLTYTNQAATYGTLLAITRKDLINDDTGALTAAPKRLGRGGALKLNDIFWTEFLGLVSASFFASGNSNINTGIADMTIGGLDATETIFMNQTDPDSKPLGIMPEIILVPTALKNKAQALMNPQGKLTSGNTSGLSDQNVFAGRFRLESSPYISNSSYTGYTSVAWWMLANPSVCPVIEIAALNGRVEPTVETADAAFNVLGIQMRGYSDIGVYRQEKRGGVHADGGAS